jgi:hypothetical protein
MNELLVGYARVSTEQQDLTAQRNGLHALGVGDDRIYVDQGLTGTNRDRPSQRLALAACRAGDTLVVTKLDRLARSLPDARDILDELTKRNVKLSLGGSTHARGMRSGTGRRGDAAVSDASTSSVVEAPLCGRGRVQCYASTSQHHDPCRHQP